MAGGFRKNAIDDIQQPPDTRRDAGFLGQFAQGGVDSPLSGFDSSARQTPLPHPWRLATPDEQNLIAFQAYDADRGYRRHEYFAV